MKDEEIEALFIKTIGGFYLSECGKNDSCAQQFYKNQLGIFIEGFRCCEENNK